MPEGVIGEQDVSERAGESGLALAATQLALSEMPAHSLATIALEATPSMKRFELHEALMSAVTACKGLPCADRLLLRVVLFSTSHGGICEVHSFTPVAQLDPASYSTIEYGGMSPLVDAMFDAVDTTMTFGTKIIEEGGDANGSVIVITDAFSSRSRVSPDAVRVRSAPWRNGRPKRLLTLLAGVNSGRFEKYLLSLTETTKFDAYAQFDGGKQEWMARLVTRIVTTIQQQCEALTGPRVPIARHA